METDKVVITADDLAEVDPAKVDEVKPPPTMPIWRRVLSGLLVLCPPLLFFVCLLDLVTSFKKEPATRHSFAMHYWGLLLACCILWTLVAIGASVWMPGSPASPIVLRDTAVVVGGLPPAPSGEVLSGQEIAKQFSPLVVTVFHPHQLPTWTPDGFGIQPAGAGAIAYAASDGLLVLTSRHVVEELAFRSGLGQEVGVSLQDEQQTLGDVVGLHNELDLALLWIDRLSGEGEFYQTFRPFQSIEVGEQIYAIGHPAGFAFTISSGLVGQKRGTDLVQISAPISPGNSGGPVYDRHGRLVGIVQSVIDKEINPNAENLNFAVRVDDLFRPNVWDLDETGLQALGAIQTQQEKAAAAIDAGAAEDPPEGS